MQNPPRFLAFAAAFEGAIALAAVILAVLFSIQFPLSFTGRATLVGLAATGPLILLYNGLTPWDNPSLKKIHRLLLLTLGRTLAVASWMELLLLAMLAGVCEELFFRGVVQPGLSRIHPVVGWLGSAIIFGFAHAVTPAYAIIAGVMGLYLSAVLWASGDNLFGPVLTHTAYDLFAFWSIGREFSRRYDLDDSFPEAEIDSGTNDHVNFP